MKIIDDHEVGKAEKVTRFVCGAILGIVIGGVAIVRLDLSSFLAIAALIVVLMLACGLLALIHGDRFWCAIFKWL